MTFLDVVKLAGAIIVSLGGGGALVFGMSGFLGKLWADRALEKQRHEYAQLTQQAQHQLDAALKRVQMELDTLGLMHSLRTKEEFNRLGELWKRFAILTDAFNGMSSPIVAPDDEEDQRALTTQQREQFSTALDNTLQFFYEAEVFIPAPITIVAAKTLASAVKVSHLNNEKMYPKLSADSYEKLAQVAHEQFSSGRDQLVQLIRKHVRGDPLD